LREYLQVLRPMLHDGEVEFRGEFYSVKGRLPGAPGTPVMMSALGPKSFEVAGEFSDGAISWVTPYDYLRQTAIPAMERGAQRAGHDRPPLAAHVSVAFADSREEAHAATAKELDVYSRLPFYQNMFAESGYPLGSNNEFGAELLDQLVVAGDEDSVGEQLTALLDSGFDRLLAMPIPVNDRMGEEQRLIELLGKL
jgi:alkanesulfonate monooxygenase SsuD/methylene tetrahydromethanopterin reductase-like flavin-dependent oxidoreductase (luciferase family)